MGAKEDYAEYLKTPHWLALRGHFCGKTDRCYACDTPRCLQIHHTSYENLGHEGIREFIVVCRDCHEKIHAALAAKWPKLRVGLQAVHTGDIFAYLFGRTLKAARKKYGHDKRWNAFYFPNRKPAKSRDRTHNGLVIDNNPRERPRAAPKGPKAECVECGNKTRLPYGSKCHCGGKIVARGTAKQIKYQRHVELSKKLQQRKYVEAAAERAKENERLGDEVWIRRLPSLTDRIKARIELRQKQA